MAQYESWQRRGHSSNELVDQNGRDDCTYARYRGPDRERDCVDANHNSGDHVFPTRDIHLGKCSARGPMQLVVTNVRPRL